MPCDPPNSLLSPTDRAILRALLTPVPRACSAATRPSSAPSDPRTDASQSKPIDARAISPDPAPSALPTLAAALAAAGLDDLDLPLWFAQPHIQDYIAAHRALEDFLDEQASRAAQREGRELLHSLAHTADSPDATCHDLCRPRHSRASPSSNPVPTASPTEQRLIATALLRAPFPRAARQTPLRANAPPADTVPSGGSALRADASLADPAAPDRSALRADTTAPLTVPCISDVAPAHHPAPNERDDDITAETADARDDNWADLADPISDDDASFAQALNWAVSVLGQRPAPAAPPPDTS